jgi:alkanesulfonate monooxygenase SsuD/methylene tetrahydromethanopterin reductase-like flavin-dependent oxidoreductase (luciferase family)
MLHDAYLKQGFQYTNTRHRLCTNIHDTYVPPMGLSRRAQTFDLCSKGTWFDAGPVTGFTARDFGAFPYFFSRRVTVTIFN